MSWVVDTSILIDVAEHDPTFGVVSAMILEEKLSRGLIICPVTYVELAPVFEGRDDLQEEFLGKVGIDWTQAWTSQDTRAAFRSWKLRSQAPLRNRGEEADRGHSDRRLCTAVRRSSHAERQAVLTTLSGAYPGRAEEALIADAYRFARSPAVSAPRSSGPRS